MQTRAIFILIIIFILCLPAVALGLPVLNNPLEGDALLARDTNRLTITQRSDFASGVWSDFKITRAEEVIFQQPNQSSVYFARIESGAQTEIEGKLTANGTIVLENSAGIRFGGNSVVNVGGLIAIAGKVPINDIPLLNWNNVSGDGTITNAGTIKVMGPTAIFAGKVFQNEITGTIEGAENIFLMVGTQFTINIGTMPVQLLVEGEALDALLANKGTLKVEQADGSLNIYIHDLEKLTSSIVNLGGAVQAKRIAINDKNNSIHLVANDDAPMVVDEDFANRRVPSHKHLTPHSADEMRIPHHYILKRKKKGEVVVHSCHGGSDHFQRIMCATKVR